MKLSKRHALELLQEAINSIGALDPDTEVACVLSFAYYLEDGDCEVLVSASGHSELGAEALDAPRWIENNSAVAAFRAACNLKHTDGYCSDAWEEE